MSQEPVQDNETEVVAEVESRANMSFLDHLEELRWTLFRCVGAFAVAVALVAFFLKRTAGFLNGPLRQAEAALSVEIGGLITTSPMAVFSVLIQICFLGGLGLSLPFILYFLSRFVAPALKKEEIRMLAPACAVALFLFLAGAAFSYFFLVPEALKFSIRLNQALGFAHLWTADRYYGLLVWTILGMGFCFQFPLVLYVLVYMRIVTTDKLRKARPYMIVVFFLLGSILTPTWDPVTQTMVALPMWLLYEVSLLLATRLEARRIREIERELGEVEEGEW